MTAARPARAAIAEGWPVLLTNVVVGAGVVVALAAWRRNLLVAVVGGVLTVAALRSAGL